MNPSGSYKALRNNSKAAMLSAIEIYNKPQISYRDECFSILLVNAWELLLKAILSKNKERIYYPKKRHQPYLTLSLQDALVKAKTHFPSQIDYEPVARNLELLITYRNNAIHFYNEEGFGVIIYGLAQTSLTNYRDLMLSLFSVDVAEEMTINLLPLSFGAQPDPVQYLQNANTNSSRNKAVAQFLREITDATKSLEEEKHDTSRFLTVFKVSLQSVKKIAASDIVVGLSKDEIGDDVMTIERRVDPNKSHPLRQKEVLELIGDCVSDTRFTSHTFQAIVWFHGVKEKPHLCWKSDTGELVRYSRDVASFIKKLTRSEIQTALEEYKKRQQSKRSTKAEETRI